MELNDKLGKFRSVEVIHIPELVVRKLFITTGKI